MLHGRATFRRQMFGLHCFFESPFLTMSRNVPKLSAPEAVHAFGLMNPNADDLLQFHATVALFGLGSSMKMSASCSHETT